MNKQKIIIMLGPSPSERGGMGTVAKLILSIVSKDFAIRHITTWNGQVSRFTKLSSAIVFIKAFLAFLLKLSRKEGDLVHLHISERGSVIRKSMIALVCIAMGKPFILHTHGCEFHQFYGQLSPGIQQLITALFRRSACLIALSESWRNYYIETCHLEPERVVVLNNPVSLPEKWQKTEKVGKLKFVFVGKINKRKGIFDILKALAKLEPEYRNQVELVLAGTGEIAEVENLATELGIEKQIVFLGWINQEQRDQLLAESDVMLLPSYNEGLPMAILEAMSWGMPIITTPVGGIPEVIENGKSGLLVTPGHIRELTAAMASLIENPALRLSLGTGARQRVEPLSIEHYTDGLLNLYRRILQYQQNQPNPEKDIESPPSIQTDLVRR